MLVIKQCWCCLGDDDVLLQRWSSPALVPCDCINMISICISATGGGAGRKEPDLLAADRFGTRITFLGPL